MQEAYKTYMKAVARLLGGSWPAEERMMEIYAFEKRLAKVGWDQRLQITILFSRKAFRKLAKISQLKLIQATMQTAIFFNFVCLLLLFLLFFCCFLFCFVFLQAAFENYYSEDLAETLQMYHRSGRSFDELDNTIADFCDASSFKVRKICLHTNMHQKIQLKEGGLL